MAEDPSPVPESCHTIIIGSGIGGLISGCLLAKAGVRVCLFEMAKKPGGYLAGYQKKGFQFDTAIHWLNQCGNKGLVRRLFTHIGTGSPQVVTQKSIRRYLSTSCNYLLTNNPDDLKRQLIADFPEEESGVEKFFKVARKLGQAFDGLGRYARYPAQMNLYEKMKHVVHTGRYGRQFLKYLRYDAEKGLALFFKDQELKKVFATDERLLSILVPIGWAYSGDYQNPPIGGSKQFPCWLVECFEAFGGMFFPRHKVERILCDGDKVSGVTWKSGAGHGHIRAENIIAACDLETVYKKMLLPSQLPGSFLKKISKLKLYNSSVMLTVALTCAARDLGFGQELICLSQSDVPRKMQNCGDPHKTSIDIIAPSERDGSLVPRGCGSLIICTSALFSYKEHWGLQKSSDGQWRRTKEYGKLKTEYADTLIDRIGKTMGIDLRAHVKFCDIATPFTFMRYTGNQDGTIMGQRPESANFKLKVTGNKTPIRHLYISGHWADYGGGVPIAVKAGANAVLPILKKEKVQAYHSLCDLLDGKGC